MYIEPRGISQSNPHFCKSALARYTQWDFIDLVGKYGIAWHEKTLGQLFCDDSAEQIVNLLLAECEKGGVQIRLRSEIIGVERDDEGYTLQLNGETVAAKSWWLPLADCLCRASAPRRLAIACRAVWPEGAADPSGPGAVHLCISRCLNSCRCFPGVGTLDHHGGKWDRLPGKSALYPPRAVRTGGTANFQLLAAGRIRQHQSAAGLPS